MQRVAFGLLLLFSLPLPASGQQLGGVSLRLDEPQDAVLNRLAAYKLKPASTGFWSVSDTTQWRGRPNFGNIGWVQFRFGRLVVVDRAWDSIASSAVGAASQILAALRQLEGSSDCAVSSHRMPEPDMQGDFVNVTCGDHEIMIGLSEQAGGRFYHISEGWMHRKP